MTRLHVPQQNGRPRWRVLHVTTWYPVREDDPTGTFVREYVRAVERFAEGSVLHIIWSDAELPHGYRLTDVSAPDETPILRLRIGQSTVQPLWLFVGVVHALTRHVRRHGRPEMLHSHTLPATALGAVVARLLRRPLVATEHWTGLLPGGVGHSSVRSLMARFAFRSAAAIMPVGPALADGIRALAGTTPVKIVPNVVDTSIFRPDTRTIKAPHQALAISSLIARKRLDLAIHAVALARSSVPDLELVVLGDGPELPHLERTARELGLQGAVRFKGAVTKSIVADWIRRSDLVVISSERETFSVVAAESMCCGVPVVTTRCGGPEHLVDRSSGIVVNSPDATSVAEAIVNVLSTTWDHAAISDSARSRFSTAAVGHQLEEIYASAMEQARSPADRVLRSGFSRTKHAELD